MLVGDQTNIGCHVENTYFRAFWIQLHGLTAAGADLTLPSALCILPGSIVIIAFRGGRARIVDV
jgi:hypothetical protein